MARAWLFPGQGTQRRGMGEHLIDSFPGLERRADEALGYSIRTLCLDDPEGRLADTRFCQPALFFVNHLSFLWRRRREPWPDFVAGHSLGELNALCASGALDFDTGLRLVDVRARLMAGVARGGMLAVIGPELADLTAVMARVGPELEVANYNLSNQTVVSGEVPTLRALSDEIARLGTGRAVHLHVSGGFHSRLTEPAALAFAAELDRVEIGDPRLPTLANVTARPYESGTVREILGLQMRRPVRWVDTMQFLHEQGVTEAVQVGPGRVLDGLWERFVPEPGRADPAAPATTPLALAS